METSLFDYKHFISTHPEACVSYKNKRGAYIWCPLHLTGSSDFVKLIKPTSWPQSTSLQTVLLNYPSLASLHTLHAQCGVCGHVCICQWWLRDDVCWVLLLSIYTSCSAELFITLIITLHTCTRKHKVKAPRFTSPFPLSLVSPLCLQSFLTNANTHTDITNLANISKCNARAVIPIQWRCLICGHT